MRFTKLYLKHFAVILGVIGGGIGLLATIPSPFFERDMVEYYCASGSLFLGKDLSRFFYCGWMVYFFHVFALMLALFLGAAVIDLLGKRSKTLEIEPVNEINSQITSEPFLGSSYGVGLKIYNKTDYEITECFGTLESVQQVFIVGHRFVYDDKPNKHGLNAFKKLRWANQDFNDKQCKVAIHGKSKENILLVANFNHLAEVVKKGKKTKIESDNILRFYFSFCGEHLKSARIPGLYKVKIRINGKVQSKPDAQDMVEYFDGFLYSYARDVHPAIEYDIYWTKEPLKDKRIIKDQWVLKSKSY